MPFRVFIFMIIRKKHYTEKVRSGKSLPPLRGLLIFECPVDILINRSLPPVHGATGGHAVRTFRPVILLGVTMRIDIYFYMIVCLAVMANEFLGSCQVKAGYEGNDGKICIKHSLGYKDMDVKRDRAAAIPSMKFFGSVFRSNHIVNLQVSR